MAVDKFRPLMSEVDIDTCLAGLALLTSTVQVAAIRKKLALCKAKINAGIVTPSARTARETVAKPSMEAGIGMSEEEQADWMEAETHRLLGEPVPAELSARIAGRLTAPAVAVTQTPAPVDLGSPFARTEKVSSI